MNSKRRKFLLGTFSLIAAPTLLAKNLAQHKRTAASKSKPLILFLSRTGNTQAVAQMIAEMTDGDLLPITLKHPYPQNYQQIVAQVHQEDDEHFLPELATDLTQISQYQQLFIGFPTWGMQLPPPIRSVLQQINWQGKTVIPFNTNGGYGLGSTFDELRQTAKGANILAGFSVPGGSVVV